MSAQQQKVLTVLQYLVLGAMGLECGTLAFRAVPFADIILTSAVWSLLYNALGWPLTRTKREDIDRARMLYEEAGLTRPLRFLSSPPLLLRWGLKFRLLSLLLLCLVLAGYFAFFGGYAEYGMRNTIAFCGAMLSTTIVIRIIHDFWDERNLK